MRNRGSQIRCLVDRISVRVTLMLCSNRIDEIQAERGPLYPRAGAKQL